MTLRTSINPSKMTIHAQVDLGVGQEDRVPKKKRFGKRKNRSKPVVPKGFLFDPVAISEV